MLTINSNIMSLNAQRNLSNSSNDLATSIQRLSTGLRINSAKDDAAGLAISERFSAQIRGLNQAVRNANDGVSLAQTAEGALSEVSNNVQRLRELAVQSSNATNSQSDRDALQAEVSQLLQEIDRVATSTNFNGVSLLDGTFNAQSFQVGANAGETITVANLANINTAALGSVTQNNSAGLSATFDGATITDLGAAAVGEFTIDGVDIGALDAAASAAERAGQFVNAVNLISSQTGVGASYNAATAEVTLSSESAFTLVSATTSHGFAAGARASVATTTGINGLDVSSFAGSQIAIQLADSALTSINGSRAELGALQSRFESVVANLQTTSENLSASRSRIQDTDFAAETANLTRAQILQQAGTAMLAQANVAPQNVLSLLG